MNKNGRPLTFSSAMRNEMIRREYSTGDLLELSKKLRLKKQTLCAYAFRLGVKRDPDVRNKAISVSVKEYIRKEKMRISWGLPQKTAWHLAAPLSRSEVHYRGYSKRKGYLPGKYFEQGERKVIYYTDETKRSKSMEAHAAKIGFKFIKLEDE